MTRPAGLTVVAVLALAQGVLRVLRALELVRIGSDLVGRGSLLLPLIGAMAFVRGALVAGIALSVVVAGESLGRALVWTVVPVILLLYLLAPAGRAALRRQT